MSRDPDEHPEFEEKPTEELADAATDEEDEDEEDDEEPVDPEHPTCPRCGWSNTRRSYSHTLMDGILRTFSFHPFRCRSCGNRFRIMCRRPRD
jgi:hypothetical protein